MNRVFRIIWSRALRTWVVASELATQEGKDGGSVDRRRLATDPHSPRFAADGWRMRTCLVAVLLALHAPAWAADRYWDSNGTDVGLGGTGSWNTSSLFWNPSSDGVSGPMDAWDNGAPGGDNAFFLGTAGTVTLAGTMNAHNLTFGVDGYTLAGGTLTLTGATPTIETATGTTTIASTIAGSGFAKTGGGILSLTGNNTFTGDVEVAAGRLMLTGDENLGAAGNGLLLADGTRLDSTGDLAASRVVTIGSGLATVTNGALSARFTGAGGLRVAGTISNDANDYTGQTLFGPGTHGFTSVADLGLASSLGAPTDAVTGTIISSAGGGLGNTLIYSGDGDTSNRDWRFGNTSSGGNQLRNSGTGTLTLTGDIEAAGVWSLSMTFHALTADMALLGVISNDFDRNIQFAGGGANRTITLGGANTYTGPSIINNVTVRAGTLADTGTNSSFGTGTGGGIHIVSNGVLSYTGAATSTDRALTIDGNGIFANDGTGAVSLTGAVGFSATGIDTFILGGSYTGTNSLSGIVSGDGNLVMDSAGAWILGGTNTYAGTTTVRSGTLVAGSSDAFGASEGLVVDGGTLDLADFNVVAPSLAGTGGTVNLGSGTLTLDATSGSTAFAGSIVGTGGLTKLGASTLTLTGQSTYTGGTTISGGTLALDFSAAGGPTGDILSSASTLTMAGGRLDIVGADGEANTQGFAGLDVTAGSNTLRATSGAGGSMTVDLGAITHAGGIVNFLAPASGAFNTSNADGALGGWATITTGTETDYAEVVGGQVVAFDDYTDQDDASLWQDGQFTSDAGGTADTPFFNTVSGSRQIAGLKYTANANSTVTVGAGQTLGLDGTIIVNSTTGGSSQTIQGGSVTGAVGGGTLGVLKNSDGTFAIASDIVDNGGAIDFMVGGTGGSSGNGTVALTGSNSYTGATTVSGATLAFDSIANGGATSAIGASSSASSNLVLENGTLRYTGGTAATDRGFTLVNGGTARNIEVTDAAAELTFSGQVTSPDDAGFNKTGAGTLTLGNAGNDYVGATTVSGGTLSVGTLADGGQASGIGASSADSSNLVLRSGGMLRYTGATATSDRGFTLDGIAGGAIDVANAGTILTLTGEALGIGGAFMRKEGAGTLVLSGTNTYAGQTFVDGGTLRAGSNQAFGGPNVMNLADVAGATLDLAGFDNKVGGLQGGGAAGGDVLLGGATLTIGGNSVTFGGRISGAGNILKENSSTQAMAGCGNDYTGTTTIQAGILSVDCLADSGLQSGIGASNDVSGGLILNGGMLEYTGSTVAIDRGFTLSGNGLIGVTSAGTTLAFSGPVIGSGNLFKRGAGTLVFAGANTYTGTTYVDEGTLRAGSTAAFGNTSLRMGAAGTLLELDGFDTGFRWIDDRTVNGDSATVGDIALGSATLTITAGGSAQGIGANVNYAGAISGTGGIVKDGGGLQQFSGCNSSYTGATTISGGTLIVDCLADGGQDSSIGASGSIASNLVLDGGGLRYVGAGGSTDREFTVGLGGGRLEASGAGAIEFTSAAPVFLPGLGDRTLTLGGTSTANNSLSARLDDSIGGTTSLTKDQAGTWILRNADSTYTGRTFINGGVLGVDKLADGGLASSIGMSSGDASNLVIGNGSTLRYTGTGDTTDRLFTLSTGVSFIESSGSGAIVFSNTGSASYDGVGPRTLALGGTNTGLNTMGGTIVDQDATTGRTTVAKNDSGTWVLTGENSYSGNTVINDGNLIIGNGGTSGNAGTGNVIVVNPTSTLSFNRSDTFNFAGELSGAGNIAQSGTGTTVLTAANNTIGGVTGVGSGTLQIAGGSNLTTGAATIGAGTLQVLAGGSLTTSSIAMNAGSTLDVAGTVQASGGATSTITGDGGDSTIDIDAGGTLRANGDLGAGGDVVNVAGTLDTGAASLGLGDGDDTLAFTEGAAILGSGIDAGAGSDTLQVDHTSPLTFDAADVTAFENLVKQNTGTLTLTGNQSFDNGVQIQGGSLDVGDDSGDSLATAAVTMADGTTLNVNGTLQDAGGTAATLTGSAGTNAVNVADGATLAANGDLGDGNDTVDLSGTLDTGAGVLGLGAGDDALTLHDGASILGAGVDAGAQSTGDTLILDNALDLAFDGSQTANFERLVKQDAGTATMTGSQGFASGTQVLGGVLGIDAGGELVTPTVAMADGTGLQVDGTLQGAGGTATAITGSGGAQTVTVNGTAVATGDLGAGNDTLDVAGTLDIGGGVFALGDGDDNFVIHDGTNVLGTIDGGAGQDTRVYDIDGTADLGALANFEGVTKTGAGTLNINGPGATDLLEVQVLGGTLDVGAGASVVAKPGETLATTIGSGATLNVDGSFGCGDGADTMTVSGTVSGSGTIDLCGGDDTLTLNDGAVLAAVVDGGAHSTADRLVLDNAAAMTFDGANTLNFEILQKDNTGEATLAGSAVYTGGTLVNGGTLTVGTGAGLTTPTVTMAGGTTLDVDGNLEGAGGAAAAIVGDPGVQTVAIDGTATATGDLGAGNDVLDVAGTLDTDGGVFALGDGDDRFVVHDGTDVNGTIDGGAGLDSRVYDIDGTAEFGALLNFEGVTKTGTGTLNISGPGATDLEDVQVLGGTLDIGATASVVGKPGQVLATTVGAGATLNVDGSFGCSDGDDSMSVSGTVSGTGTIDLCGGDDTLTLGDGAVLANVIDGGAQGAGDRVVLDNAGAMTFDGANTVDFEILQKDNVGAATLTGAADYSGGTELNGGTLAVGTGASLTTPTVVMMDDTTLDVRGSLQGAGGATTITGSAGTNTVGVGAGATLTATGDLGDGNDVLDAAGTIDTDGGVLSLGAGDDAFNVYDTTDTSLATIDGGAGNDLLDVDVGGGNTVPLGGLTGFESLGKSGDGTLEIRGASDFIDVALDDGTLRVTGTGSIAAQNTTILSGATLDLADGGTYSGTAGDDTFTVAGTVISSGSPDTGRIDLADGDDTFTLQDGADLSGLAPEPVSGGAGTDTFVADLAGTATLGGAVDFETLTKTNTGTLVVAGPAASSFATVNVEGGLLDIGIAGSLTGVRDATVASGAALNIDGAFGFTNGADSFTVAGTVTGGSGIDMLAGDDTFTLQDGADLSGLAGPVDGGDGNDTFVSDLAGTATLGGAVNFETLNKTNTGTLVVAGPAASAFTTVNVAGGTLDVGVNGALDGVVTGTVAGGATLNVDGRYTGSAGSDELTVAGTVSGSGDIALGDGDDRLVLHDGADLAGLAGVLDGGAHGAGDRVVLDNAGSLTFDAGNVVNFEYLQKDGAGEATLAGDAAFGSGTRLDGGTLSVTGNLVTPTIAMGDDTTLDVDGGLAGDGSGAAATITGSAGVNTVAIDGTALANGDLGAGNDVLDVAGALDTDGGIFGLGDGDDDFVVHDGTIVTGTVDGGAGLDSRVYDIAGTAEFGALLNFEGVTKRGTGVLNISGPGATDLQSVEVEGGTLNVGAAGSVVATAGMTLNTIVASGATLNVDGSFGCGASDDSMTVAGTVSGAGTVAMCGGDDTLTLQDGAMLATTIDGGADTDTVVLDTATAMSFDGARTSNFEVLQKDGAGVATLTGIAAYTGGTLLNGGTLTVDTGASLTTPTVALADDTTLDVGGALQGDGGAAAITGSAGANTVNVGGHLLATGDLGGGNDVLDVSGTLDTGDGSFALGDGDDMLTIHDGTNIVGIVVAGAGNDTFNTDIATNADLGAVQGFETLRKTGAGTLDVNGPASSDFTTVDVLAGTLNVTSGGSITAQSSTVAEGATLQIDGSYLGTDGDDTFTSSGTVRGALAFGEGNDTVRFAGGDIDGLTGAHGGAGSGDLLSFSGLELDDGNVAGLVEWERVELLDGSALTLGTGFMPGGVLAIDGTSQLFASAGASIGGSVENAGRIDVGADRLAIGGDYIGTDGALTLTVSAGGATSGGLDVAGDVVGTTRVTFDSDGSAPAADTTEILVIASPNDDAATAGGFAPDGSADGLVRLDGSPFAWTFGQEEDRNWYLSTEAEPDDVLPEITGYGVLPGLGVLMGQRGGDIAHQRMAGVRGTQPRCSGDRDRSGQVGTDLFDDCNGTWVAATGTEVELGADPGFEVSGDDTGLYVGVDGTTERGSATLRGGAYLGYLHSVYWATGLNSSAVSAMGPARVELDTPIVGLYGTSQWGNGRYVDLVLTGQNPRAKVRTADGFAERIDGDTLSLSARFGQRYRLDGDWVLEPQLQLSASRAHWDDKTDAAGRVLRFDDALVTGARAALRAEKSLVTDGGAQVRPWAELSLRSAFGGNDNGLRLAGSDVAPSAFPGHDLGTSAHLDVGVEATIDRHVSFFGVLSIAQDLEGSDYEQRGLNAGLRVRW